MSDEQVRDIQRWIAGALYKVNGLRNFMTVHYVTPDDFRQEMFISVWRSLPKYDAKRGRSFKSWVYMVAIYAAMRYMMQVRSRLKIAPIEDALQVASPQQFEDGCENVVMLQEALSKQSDRVKRIVALRAKGLNLAEIGEREGVDWRYVSKLICKVRKTTEVHHANTL